MPTYTSESIVSELEGAEALPEQMNRELDRVANALLTRNDLEAEFQADIIKARQGMLRFFDETVFVPGNDGTGVYVFIEGVWYRMALIGSGPAGGAMMWRNVWSSALTYYPHDVVMDGGWLMAANKETIEQPAPQETGSPTYELPDVPAFVQQSFVGTVLSGHEYTLTQNGWIVAFQAWAAETGATVNHQIILSDITDPANPQLTVIDDPTLTANQWSTISIGNSLSFVGQVLRLTLVSQNSGGTTEWTHQWINAGISNAVAPAATFWNRRQQEDIVRLNDLDASSTDQSTDLLLIVSGSIIRFSNQANANQFLEYFVNSSADVGGSFELNVTLQATGIDGPVPDGVNTTVRSVQPVPQATLYEELPLEWPGNNPTWATITGQLSLDGVPQVGDDTDAYGVRMLFQPASISADWDFMAFTDLGGAGSSRQSATINDSTQQVSQTTGRDFTDQVPAGIGIGNQIQVSFGPDQSPDLDALGTFIAQDNAQYNFAFQVNAERTTAGGEAHLWLYATKNGAQIGASQLMILDTQRQRTTFAFSVFENLTAGDEMKFFMYRDASMMNDGFLKAHINPDGLIDALSAFLEVTQSEVVV